MTPPAAPAARQPRAQAAYRKHALYECPYGGDMRRCAECRDLDHAADLDAASRHGWPDDSREWSGWL